METLLFVSFLFRQMPLIVKGRPRARRLALRMTALLRTPHALLRTEGGQAGSRVLELRTMQRGVIGACALLGVLVTTAFQMHNFALNHVGEQTAMQPGSSYADGMAALATPTALSLALTLVASGVTCEDVADGAYSVSASLGGGNLTSLITCSSAAYGTVTFAVTAGPTLPSMSSALTVVLSARGGNVVFAPELSYNFTAAAVFGDTFGLTETVVAPAGEALTGATAVDVAFLPTQARDLALDVKARGYGVAYQATRASSAAAPATLLALSVVAAVPPYSVLVQQVETITPLQLLANVLALAGGVLSAASAVGQLAAFAARTRWRAAPRQNYTPTGASEPAAEWLLLDEESREPAQNVY